MSRVVVIGAGVGGLASAARLAATGHEVTLFEQAPVVGGKLGSWHRDGFTFDTGPSLLTLPQALLDVFEATGSTVELTRQRLDPVVRHVFADGPVLDSCSDAAEFADRIGVAFGAGAAADWARFWRRAGRIWDASWHHILRSPVDGPTVARLAWRLPELAAIAPGRTLRGLGRSYLGDPRLRMMLDRYATYTGSDPRRAPAALAAIPYAELHHGGWYVLGGLARIASALADRCTTLGVPPRLSTPVVGIRAERGRVRGVRLADGSTVDADVVVANADAAAVYRDLLPTPRRLRPLAERSSGGFVLLLGVRGRTPGLAHHTVFFPRDADPEFDALFRAPRPVPDPTIFVTVPDDPLVRPDGHEAWFVLVNAAPQGAVDWRAPGLAEEYADLVLRRLAERGVDIRDRIVFREVRTPADLEVATLTPGGAIYGTPSHRLLRPSQRGPVAGLYLVGGSTHPGGGLPLVLLSAAIATAEINSSSR